MGKLTFVIGGARSGKSSFAQRLANRRAQAVVFIATAEALDAEMEARIQTHRQERPRHWRTLEATESVAETIAKQSAKAELYLLDCLSLLVSNLLLSTFRPDGEPDPARSEDVVNAEIQALLDTIRQGEEEWIVVSNEVGMGLVPPYPLGRLYRDLLGRANQRLAADAHEVYYLVAGIPLPVHLLKDSESLSIL